MGYIQNDKEYIEANYSFKIYIAYIAEIKGG